MFLKTGFEALTGLSRTSEAMKDLVRIFKSAERQLGSGIGLESLLWQADEGTRTRTFNRRSCEVTKIEAWYGELADARNSIIHGGALPNLNYDELGSPYAGHLLEIGDRVLREAIKVEIGNLGCPDAWRGPIGRASLEALRDCAGPSGEASRTES